MLPALDRLRATLHAKADAFAGVVMLGRTHLQDATPVTLGQVIGGWAGQLDDARATIVQACAGLYPLALGGTAVGTGLNAHPQFGDQVAAEIARSTGKPFTSAPNKFALMSAHDAVVTASAALRTLAGALMKIANDVRLYASGPRAGFGEITIPDNEPGSSIMPGKINPTQCEALTQVPVQVFGNDAAVAFAGTQGNFQLNVYKPVMLHNLLESANLLADAVDSFDTRCARGIEPDTGAHRRARRAVADAGHRAQPAHRLREFGEDRVEGVSRAHGPQGSCAGAGPRVVAGFRSLGESRSDDAARLTRACCRRHRRRAWRARLGRA